MMFPSRDPAGVILPAGTSLPIAGNCEAGRRTLWARLAFSFGFAPLAHASVVSRFPGTGANKIRGLIHAAAHVVQNIARRVSESNPVLHQAPPSMNELHHGRLLCGGQKLTGAGQ